MADLYEVQAAYTEVGEALTDAGTAAYDYSSPDSMVDSLKAIQEELDKQIEALEKLAVPEALKEYNDDMVSALKEMSSAFGSFVDAVEAGDETAMIEASNDLTEVMTLFAEIDDPEETIEEKYDTSKLDDLEKNIETEISSLKNVSFVLF
jgi:acyl-CoA reductase-like NAD-dependent aldehyde dehydrogenase